jgi:hypothetical protein
MRTTTTTHKQDRVESIISGIIFVATMAAFIFIKCIIDPA